MKRIHIVLGFIAGVLDGFGWLGIRNWLSDRIIWDGPVIDAFDLSSDWFARKHYSSTDESSDIDFQLEDAR